MNRLIACLKEEHAAAIADLQSQIDAIVVSTNPPCTYQFETIWGEENGAVSNNQLEYSYGNGATGLIGIPLPPGGGWELYGMGFQADVASAGAQLTFAVVNAINNTNLTTATASGATNNINWTTPVGWAPVVVPDPMTVGFRTVNELGNVVDARAAAYFRRVIPTFQCP